MVTNIFAADCSAHEIEPTRVLCDRVGTLRFFDQAEINRRNCWDVIDHDVRPVGRLGERHFQMRHA